jgi:ANTAR domain/GAF domain
LGVGRGGKRVPLSPPSARTAGVKSFLSAPLFIDEKFAGSLNLYGREADSFDDLDESLVRLYTAAAAAAIANARRYAEARRLAENLRRAIESRAVIDQAIGMLMATRGLDAETAFRMLARESQNTNTKLRDVAARIVNAARRPRSGPGGTGLRAPATGTQPAAYGGDRPGRTAGTHRVGVRTTGQRQLRRAQARGGCDRRVTH